MGVSIIGIDPGPLRSAFALLDTVEERIVGAGWERNEDVGLVLSTAEYEVVIIEAVTPRYGVDVGWDTLETVRTATQLECIARGRGFDPMLCPAPVALTNLGVVMSRRAGEPRPNPTKGRRDALVDRFGGKDHAIGRKSDPGPLYLCRGNEGHIWPATALAVYAWDNPDATPYQDLLEKARAKRSG